MTVSAYDTLVQDDTQVVYSLIKEISAEGIIEGLFTLLKFKLGKIRQHLYCQLQSITL